MILMDVAPPTPIPKKVPLASKLIDSSISLILCPSATTILASSSTKDLMCPFAFSIPFLRTVGSTYLSSGRYRSPLYLKRSAKDGRLAGLPLAGFAGLGKPFRVVCAFATFFVAGLSITLVLRPGSPGLFFTVMQGLSRKPERKSMHSKKEGI